MEYGSHISLAQLSLPSLLEVTAQENLLATLQPAFLHLLQVVGGSVPWVGAVNRHCGLELFTLLHGGLQHYCLRTHGCSLSEHFYDLKRVDLRELTSGGKQQEKDLKRVDLRELTSGGKQQEKDLKRVDLRELTSAGEQQEKEQPHRPGTKKQPSQAPSSSSSTPFSSNEVQRSSLTEASATAVTKDVSQQLHSSPPLVASPSLPPPAAAAIPSHHGASKTLVSLSTAPSSLPTTHATDLNTHNNISSCNTTPSQSAPSPAPTVEPPSAAPASTSTSTLPSPLSHSSSSISSSSSSSLTAPAFTGPPSMNQTTSSTSTKSSPTTPVVLPTPLESSCTVPTSSPAPSALFSKALLLLWSAPCQQLLLRRLTALLLPSQSWHTRSMVVLVLLPYLHHKINQAYLKYCDEQDLPQQQQAGRLHRLCTSLLSLWPYMHAGLGLLNMAYYIRYLSGVSSVCSLKHRLSGVTLRRVTQEEQQQDEEGQASGSLSERVVGGASRLLMEGVEVGAFVLQFLDWWYSSDRGLAAAAGAGGVIPPPPPLLQGGAGAPPKGGCPICQQPCNQPTALAVSGYVFCYSCIRPRLRSDQHCPVTGHPATAAQLIKLYQH